ncbi:MAG: Acyl-homoserine lactone acylase PvdQ [Acidimicrobiales bacterium]|nr:Acyl-homoserine lactone acylase PvdQ [Acidimicrobiales bacterium]
MLFPRDQPAGAQTSRSAITIYRDHYGVGHIEAANLQGLSWATGYLTAKDRLFEMDAIRKLGQGRLSELIGPSMLPADRFTRREFVLPNDIEGQYQRLSPQLKSLYAAYAAGVNQGAIETLANPATASILFPALGDPWEPWKPEDSVTVDMVFTMVNFGGEGAAGEMDNAKLLSALTAHLGPVSGLKAFNDMDPPTTADAPSAVAPGEGPPVPRDAGYDVRAPTAGQQSVMGLPGLYSAAAAQTSDAATARAVLDAFHIPLPRIGSYAAGLSGARTANGGGLLLGSPQSGLEAPPIFYEVGWHIAGHLDCEGFTVPGLGPGLGVGWCNQHAWSLVAGNMGDQADLYVERLDPQNPHRYFFDGQWRDTVRRSTTYVVKSPVGCKVAGLPAGPCPPQVITETYDYTVHGPISQVDSADHLGLAYRRAQTGVFLGSLTGTLGWNLSTSMAGFDAASDALTATFNITYVDTEGHLAYRLAGLQPVRPGTDRRFPMPGTGDAEWKGFLSACQMPHVVDPPSGYVATNQGTETKPISWWPNPSQVGAGVASRIGHDQQLLDAQHGATVATLEAVNRHFLEGDDPYASTFFPLFEHALRGSNDPAIVQALALLESWKGGGFARTDADGDGKEDHAGLTIFELDNMNYAPPTAGFPVPLGTELVKAVFGDVAGGLLPNGGYLNQISAAYDALAGRTAYRFVSDPDAVIRNAVSAVLAQLTKEFKTSDTNRWHRPFPTEPFTAIGVLAPPPVKGMDHGSYSQIVDPRAGVGENIEPPGNWAADSAAASAQLGLGGPPPPHFEDQRALYEAYRFKPMRMTAPAYQADAEAVLHLDDGGSFGSDLTVPFTAARDACRGVAAGAAAGSTTHAVLPATGESIPRGVAVLLLVLGVAARRYRGHLDICPRRAETVRSPV